MNYSGSSKSSAGDAMPKAQPSRVPFDPGLVFQLVPFQTLLIKIEMILPIVKAHYGVYSAWRWGEEPYLVSGHIEILSWKRRRIRLRERLVVVNSKGDDRSTFRGVRNFRWEKPEVE